VGYDNAVFGHRLMLCRNNRGLTQDNLAAMSGVSKDNIARYEQGLNKPGLDKAYALAVALDVTLDELVGFEPLVIDGAPAT
jgi:transcriptional regulator with XRE-family HTH domain